MSPYPSFLRQDKVLSNFMLVDTSIQSCHNILLSMYFSDVSYNIDYTHFSISLSFLECKQHKKGSKTCTSYHDLEEALTKRNSSKMRFFKVKTAVFLV